MIDMVSKAWRDVPEEVVKRSFKLCGINTALDGSEDSMVNDAMADALNHAAREHVRDEALGLIFDDDSLDESDFEGFTDEEDVEDE